nr:MFS transporter [Acholeplasma laidlawii]
MSLIVGILIYGVMQILFGLGHVFDMWTLSSFRLISGFGMAAALTILTGEMIITSDKDKRAKNIAFGAAAIGLGGAIGQFLGGFIHTNSLFIKVLRTDIFFNAFLLQGISVGFFALLIAIWFKPKKTVVDPNKKRVQFWEGFKEVRHIKPELLYFLIALTLITIASTNVEKYLDVYFKDLGFLANELGNFKMIAGVVSLLSGIILVPLFMRIKHRLKLISVFQIISAVLIFTVFRSSSSTFLILLYTMYMAYIAIKASFTPLEQDHISKFSGNHNVATTLGIRQSFYSIGTIIGPIFGAFLYDYSPRLLFDTSVVLFLISLVLIFISNHYRKRDFMQNTVNSNI